MIRRRGSVFQVEVRIGKDPTTGKWLKRAATFDTEKDAVRAERRMLSEAEALRAAHVNPTRQLLGVYLTGWLKHKHAEGRKARTLYDYAHMIEKNINPVLGATPLMDLSPAQIQRWQDSLATQADAPGAAQAAYAHRVLRAALSDAVRLGLIPTNPAKNARPAQRSRRKRKGYTLDQAKALFAAAEGRRIRHLLEFIYYSGLRRGEAIALKWSDVHMQSGTITVQRNRVAVGKEVVTNTPKTDGSTRTFTLPALARAALTAEAEQQQRDRPMAGERWRDEGWVFATETGGPLHPSNVDRDFRRVRTRAGLPEHLPLYSLRHGTASILLSSGVPMGVAAKMMGHTQVATFADTYAELLLEASQQAATQVDAFLERHSGVKPSVVDSSRGRGGRPRASARERGYEPER